MKRTTLAASLVAVIAIAFSSNAQTQDPKEKVAMIKSSLAGSEAALRAFEWIETTTVSVKGEEKSQKVNRCYYGADGKLQKVPVVAPPPEEKERGLRGRIVEKKKEEMTEYMQEAVALVKTYAPPDPAKLNAVREAGGLSIQPLAGGSVLRLTFADYEKKGDSLSIDIDNKGNRLPGVDVNTTMESDREPVTMALQYGTIQGAIVYPATTTLNAAGKHLTVVVANSGYRKAVAP